MASNKESFRVGIIGAGFSGLCAGIKLKTDLGLENFTIFEECSDIGGTWFVNQYPGCACDVPGHLYSYSFCPKYDWNHVFPSQPEVFEYMKDVARQYNLYPHTRFNSRVQTLQWNDKGYWSASILNTKTNEVTQEEFNIVINATGRIRIPHYPKEYLNFKGPILHSAEWDHSISYEGKKVGVIGTGASAIQIVAAVAPKVEHLTVFQRKAPYIMPRPQAEYSDFTKWAFSTIPGCHTLARAALFMFSEFCYPMTRYNSITNKLLTKYYLRLLEKELPDPILRQKVTPNYVMGCKRLLLSDNYYSTLARPNVDLITEKIEKVEDYKIRTTDKEIDLDVLILATGFQPHDFFSPMRVYGRNGVDVLEEWKRDRPNGYLGILSSSMPNYFTVLGPYTALGHNSNIFNIECQVDWTIMVLKKMLERNASFVSVKTEGEDEFMKFIDEGMKDSVWTKGQCSPWYLNEKGVNTTLWPSTQIQFYRMCRTVDESLIIIG